MTRKIKRALVRGRPASFWNFRGDNLVLVGVMPGEETDVPAAHLIDEAEMERHYRRLADKRWVDPRAIEELREIADGSA